MNEQDQFLKELGIKEEQGEAFGAPQGETGATGPTGGDDPEKVEEDLKNRRHRRLEAKLQAEREANIQMAAKLEAITEAKKFLSDSEPAEYLKSVERIYGTDSPEALAATELLKNALLNVKEVAKQEALDTIREERRKEAEALKKEEEKLDQMVEELEDEYGVDLTSSSSVEMRKGFFKMLEKLSPKDSDGNILNYADHHAVWEEYQSRLKKKTDNRAKDLSSRSMIQGAGVNDSKLQDDAQVRFLRENGII